MKHFLHRTIALSLPLILTASGFAQSPKSTVDAKELPHIMRFCGPVRCGTLTFDSGRYTAVWDDGKAGDKPSYFTVESFAPKDVQLKRTDADGGKALLTGVITPQGDRVANGKQVYVDPKGKPITTTGFNLGWVQPLSAKGHPMPFSEIQDTPATRDMFLGLLMLMMAPGNSPESRGADQRYNEYQSNLGPCWRGIIYDCAQFDPKFSPKDDDR